MHPRDGFVVDKSEEDIQWLEQPVDVGDDIQWLEQHVDVGDDIQCLEQPVDVRDVAQALALVPGYHKT